MISLGLLACSGAHPSTAPDEAANPRTREQAARAPATGHSFCSGTRSTPPSGPDCVSGTIACGETLVATTAGGTAAGDSELYESAFCFPPHDAHAGPDRFYAFDLAPEQSAWISLDSPCADLSLVALSWPEEARCPRGSAHTIAVCEGKELTRAAELKLWTKKKRRYLVGVDGPAGTEAAFELSVRCEA